MKDPIAVPPLTSAGIQEQLEAEHFHIIGLKDAVESFRRSQPNFPCKETERAA